MQIDSKLTARQLAPDTDRVFSLAAAKAKAIDRTWDTSRGTPVFTVEGKYTTRGWTEWTQGFVYGCMILAGDALDDDKLIQLGKRRTLKHMLPHVTHTGNLLRLPQEKRMHTSGGDGWEEVAYANAIAASGAVQAARWSGTPGKPDSKHAGHSASLGYIHSFNGPHSLFIDTMRTTRILGVAWQLGHDLMHEGDRKANLLKRSVLHGLTTSQYIVFHGPPEGKDEANVPYAESHYNVRGRTAHEGTFNRNDGAFRARATQQGYSPFSTWTRGLAWAVLGYAEELEFFKSIDPRKFKEATGMSKAAVLKVYEANARDTADHYINDVTAADGITYWDDGAPGMHKLGDWQSTPADPYNDYEPVDASASAIAAQGLIRLGNYLGRTGKGRKYFQAGLTVARTLFDEPYLSTKRSHQGLLLHSIYHWPNHWDHVPAGSKVAHSESSQWGDYHLLELALLIKRMGEGGPYLKFYL